MRIGKLILFNKKKIKSFYHVSCIFKTFENARDVRNMITNVIQVSGFYDISAADQVYITELVEKLKPIHNRIILRKKNVKQKEQGCKITMPKSYNSLQSFGGSALKVLYTNADQLTSVKFNELMCKIKLHKPLIVAIWEVKPKTKSNPIEYKIHAL